MELGYKNKKGKNGHGKRTLTQHSDTNKRFLYNLFELRNYPDRIVRQHVRDIEHFLYENTTFDVNHVTTLMTTTILDTPTTMSLIFKRHLNLNVSHVGQTLYTGATLCSRDVTNDCTDTYTKHRCCTRT